METVNHPAHYGGDTTYEVIKVIEAWGLGFHLGNAVKYIARAGKKDPALTLEDLDKALWYLGLARQQAVSSAPSPTLDDFSGLTLSQIGKRLLEEHGGALHGSVIETRAKAGGFKSDGVHFQAYLAVALRRAGGFENIGRNIWKLNPSVPPGGVSRAPTPPPASETIQDSALSEGVSA